MRKILATFYPRCVLLMSPYQQYEYYCCSKLYYIVFVYGVFGLSYIDLLDTTINKQWQDHFGSIVGRSRKSLKEAKGKLVFCLMAVNSTQLYWRIIDR